MADLKQLKIVRDGDLDGDPLAELTRIMGIAPQSAPEVDDFGDFGIDLEAELLGAFDHDDTPPLRAANAPASLTPARAAFDRPLSAPDRTPVAFAHETLRASFERPRGAEAPPVSEQGFAAEAIDIDLAAAFEDALSEDAFAPEAARRDEDLGAVEASIETDHLAPAAGYPTAEDGFEAALAEMEEDLEAGTAPMERQFEAVFPGLADDGHAAAAQSFEPSAGQVREPEPVQHVPLSDEFGEDDLQPAEASPAEVAMPVATGDAALQDVSPRDMAHEELPVEPVEDVFQEHAPVASFLQEATSREADMRDADPLVQPGESTFETTAAHAGPAPVAAQAPAIGSLNAAEPIFDPFAELAAMAALSTDRVASIGGRAPETAPAPAASRVFEAPDTAAASVGSPEPVASEAVATAAARAEPSRIFSRANLAAPAGAAMREGGRHATPSSSDTPRFDTSPRPAVIDAAHIAPAVSPAAPEADLAPVDVDRALDAMIGAYRPAAPAAELPAAWLSSSHGEAAAPAAPVDLIRPEPALDEARFDASVHDEPVYAEPVFDEEAFEAELFAEAAHANEAELPVADARSAASFELPAPEPAWREEIAPSHEPRGFVAADRSAAVEPSAPRAYGAAAAVAAAPAFAAPANAVTGDDLDRMLDDMLGEFGLDVEPAPRDIPMVAADWSDAASAAPAGWQPQGSASAFEFDGPDLEMVEVPEYGVEPAGELDIPDLAFEEDLPVAVQPDELELQFASAFADLNEAPLHASYAAAAGVGAAASMRRGRDMSARDVYAHDPYGHGQAASGVGSREAAVPGLDAFEQEWNEARAYARHEAEPRYDTPGEEWPRDEFQVEALDDGEVASAFHGGVDDARDRSAPRARRRGLLVAGLVAGVAVIGGVAAFAFTRGGADGPPVVVRADPEPVKVRPETPGGVIVPNQDKAVYERVSGAQDNAAPTQETLVSAREEPVELDVRDVTPISEGVADDDLAVSSGAKVEERVEAIDDEFQLPAEEAPVVAPRRVRTMVVRADGTLVPREDETPVAEAPAPTAPAELAQPLVQPAETQPAEAQPVAVAQAADTPLRTEPIAEAPIQEPPVRRVETTTITPDNAASQRMPDRGPVAPTRPADQPVDIVGNTSARAAAPTQVAAAPAVAQPVSPPAPAAATSEWAMQIASQPTPDAAQASYADLSRRYGAVLGGRGVNIVKADIPGKGTFWRVRIPAASRAEANTLCERYKAAGGSCFVAR